MLNLIFILKEKQLDQQNYESESTPEGTYTFHLNIESGLIAQDKH